MALFNELQTLDAISKEAFQTFDIIKSHEEKGKDVLVVCPTLRGADKLFKDYAKDRLSSKMSFSGKWIEVAPDEGKIYFKGLNSLHTWLPGRKFKKIYFRED